MSLVENIQVVINDMPKNWRAWALFLGFVLILVGMASNAIPLQWFGGLIMVLGVLPTSLLEKIYEDLQK